MFERFTGEARRIVELAQDESAALKHNYIGTEHILLGVLAEGRGPGARALAGLGLDRESARAAVTRLLGNGMPSQPDAEALGTIGIDLTEVRKKVEQAFGPGALERPVTTRRRSRGRGRRACREPGRPGFRPFTPRAKKVLELALKEALSLNHRHINGGHVVLGILAEGQGVAVRLSQETGIDTTAARMKVLEELNRVASDS